MRLTRWNCSVILKVPAICRYLSTYYPFLTKQLLLNPQWVIKKWVHQTYTKYNLRNSINQNNWKTHRYWLCQPNSILCWFVFISFFFFNSCPTLVQGVFNFLSNRKPIYNIKKPYSNLDDAQWWKVQLLLSVCACLLQRKCYNLQPVALKAIINQKDAKRSSLNVVRTSKCSMCAIMLMSWS